MGDVKSANRIARPRDEGIYRVESEAHLSSRVRCLICGMVLSSAVFPRSSHAKKHVREGRAAARKEYGHDGPRTVYAIVRATTAGCRSPDGADNG